MPQAVRLDVEDNGIGAIQANPHVLGHGVNPDLHTSLTNVVGNIHERPNALSKMSQTMFGQTLVRLDQAKVEN